MRGEGFRSVVWLLGFGESGPRFRSGNRPGFGVQGLTEKTSTGRWVRV